MAEAAKPTCNWYDAFPPLLPREIVLSNLSSPELLLVDVRRTDFEGGTIKGSLNLPAHSFFMNRGVLYALCKRAGVKQIAFYCGE
jgi:arsenical-resistance protein 2